MGSIMKSFRLIKWSAVVALCVLLAVGYFVPMHIGWCGERPVARFRFQVFEYDTHAYGSSDPWAVLFQWNAQTMGKYGPYVFDNRLGGVAAYLGLAQVTCRNSGTVPTANASG